MTTPAFRAGIYDIPEDVYHADPVPGGSLSFSGARKLLPPSCPAIYAYEREQPPAPSPAMELGTAAHRLMLGCGKPLGIVEAQDWRTKKAREQAAEFRACGSIPLLTHEYEQVKAMAEAVRRHPLALALLKPGTGAPEQSIFWEDSGIWRRVRLDWLPKHGTRERLIIVEYKTALSADPAHFSKAVLNYGYHQQASWYLDAVTAMFPSLSAAFVFIIQQKTPPYLVTVAELDPVALAAGRRANELAIEIYRSCRETGEWPGYSDGVVSLALPPWAERAYFEEIQ